MEPRDAPGTEADDCSFTQVSACDAKTGEWTHLPALPESRGSHDVSVTGDTLYLVGGFTHEDEPSRHVEIS